MAANCTRVQTFAMLAWSRISAFGRVTEALLMLASPRLATRIALSFGFFARLVRRRRAGTVSV